MIFVYCEIIAASLGTLYLMSWLWPVKGWVSSARRSKLVTGVLIMAFVSLFLAVGPGTRVEVTEVEGARFARIIVLCSLAAMSCVALLGRIARIGYIGVAQGTMFLFALVAMGSYFYSTNPPLSLWKGFELFAVSCGFLLIKTCLRTTRDVADLLDTVWLIILVLVVTAIWSGVFSPEIAFVRQMGGTGGRFAFEYWGVFPRIHPNSLAQFGAIIGVIGFWHVLRGRGLSQTVSASTIGILGLSALLLAHSRTSLVGLMVGLVIVLVYGRKQLLAYSLTAVFAIFGSFSAVKDVVRQYVVRGQTDSAFRTLSGRLDFWPEVWEAYERAPIIGHGYYSGHRDLSISSHESLSVSSVDNTYLEVLVDLGIVGFAMIVLALIAVVLSLYDGRPGKGRDDVTIAWRNTWVTMVSVLAIICARSLTGPTFQVLHPNLILFLTIAVSASVGGQMYKREMRLLGTQNSQMSDARLGKAVFKW